LPIEQVLLDLIYVMITAHIFQLEHIVDDTAE